MRTYTYNLMTENGYAVGTGYAPGYTGRAAKLNTARVAGRIGRNAKNVALFLAAPFIGLAYLVVFPFVGIALLAWVAAKAAMKNEKTRPIAMAIAAPFIGLAFVTVGPIAGLGALVWYAGKKLMRA